MSINDEFWQYVISEESYGDGAVIIKEGAHGDWAYLIIEGSVKIKKESEKGRLTLQTLKPGDTFGEVSLLQEGKDERSAFAIAEGPVRVALLDKSKIIEELNQLSPHMKQLILKLSQRLKDARKMLISLVD